MENLQSWDDWERNFALHILQTLGTAAHVVHGVLQSLMECCSAATESLHSFSYEATKKVTPVMLSSLNKDLILLRCELPDEQAPVRA